MKIEKFEDLTAWQKARELAYSIYSASGKSPFSKDFGLRDQIRRASVSIMANIAEGFGRKSNKEFIRFLDIAHGSALEVRSHLYIALDLGYLEKTQFDELQEITLSTCKLIGGFLNYLRKRNG